MFLIWGIFLIPSKVVIPINIPLSYILMGVFLKPIEEKWLEELYGYLYVELLLNYNIYFSLL